MDRIPRLSQFSDPVVATRLAAVEYAAQNATACRSLAVPLARAAGDAEDSVAMAAAEALEMLGPPALGDLPELIQLVNEHSDGEIVYWAVTLIGRLGPTAAAGTECLTAALVGSPFLPVRERCAWAIARIGTAAESAIAALNKAAETGPPRLARLATHAIESIRGMAA